MNRSALYFLMYVAAAVFFAWKTYRALTDPVLPGKEIGAGVVFTRPAVLDLPMPLPGNAQYTGLSAILARPVFRPDRRPVPGAANGVPQRNYEAELARYTVLGVVMMGDDKKAVVVSNPPGNAGRWEVGIGDSLPGFTVKEITTDGIVLSADGRELMLPLYAGGPKSAGSAPLRTEAGPAALPARPQPPAAATAPGTAPPSPVQSIEMRRVAPFPSTVPAPSPGTPRIPQRTYPRRYVPGQR